MGRRGRSVARAGGNEQTQVVALPDAGRVYAVVVGIENYRGSGPAPMAAVDYARNDAEEFARALACVFPAERLDVRLLLDEDATVSTIDYELRNSVGVLAPDDLLVFYYAGHGFHGVGGNRVTGWDTNAHHVDTTTVLLRDSLFDRFEASAGRRLLVFVDACSRNFAPSVRARDVVSDMDPDELRSFLTPDRYTGVFLASAPGQPSFPADAHGHGAWTYYLLRALRGEAEEALDRSRYLTDRTLRDYLAREVPAFIRGHTEFRGLQQPQAITTASRTFAIRQVPERIRTSGAAGDLSDVRISPEREFFERVQTGAIAALDGFSRRAGHFVPERVNDAATQFVRGLLRLPVEEEMQAIYEHVKEAFGLRRRDISREDDVGQGSISTDVFRFSIEAAQDGSDPGGYVLVRRLELREGGETRLEALDDVFGQMFERIVVTQRGEPPEYDDLVDTLEDLAESLGGSVSDEPARGRVSYSLPDGTTLVFDTESNVMRLEGGGRQDCSALLERARRYRFGLTARSMLLGGDVARLEAPRSQPTRARGRAPFPRRR